MKRIFCLRFLVVYYVQKMKITNIFRGEEGKSLFQLLKDERLIHWFVYAVIPLESFRVRCSGFWSYNCYLHHTSYEGKGIAPPLPNLKLIYRGGHKLISARLLKCER